MFTRAFASAAVLAALMVPSAVFAAPPAQQGRVTDRYAMSIIKKAANQRVGRYGRGWDVHLGAFINYVVAGPPARTFNAEVNWGPGPHIMIAVPDLQGIINLQKGRGAPKGVKRVTFTNLPAIEPMPAPAPVIQPANNGGAHGGNRPRGGG
ncbi:MAG: hypothetical protein IT371_31200 [Deltaproteobacteria bacterium]|nr:hypothetical protein [Deltaproteobacteria bacterium]